MKKEKRRETQRRERGWWMERHLGLRGIVREMKGRPENVNLP